MTDLTFGDYQRAIAADEARARLLEAQGVAPSVGQIEAQVTLLAREYLRQNGAAAARSMLLRVSRDLGGRA